MFLRQSTASQEILLGRFLDSTDGDSEEVGLTIANTDIKLWKHGATTLASKNSGGATHIANGLYYAVLDATDTDTLGNLEVHAHPSGALAVKRDYTVVSADVYDAMFGTGIAEPAAVFAWPASWPAILGWLGVRFSNKSTLTDAGVKTQRNRADSSTIATGTDEDNGTTFTQGKWL